MDSDISRILEQYASTEPRRAAGGIYAMAGFAFQARVYVAELAEALARSEPDLGSKGDVFVEALSDIAKYEGARQLVLLQVKRTLTPATLDSAAGEVAAIEAFVASARPDLNGTFKYGVVSEFNRGATQWIDLPKGSSHKSLIERLGAEGRLISIRTEKDPWWRAVATLWPQLDDPYGFARFAFERVLLRRLEPEDARACRDAIAERYATSRRAQPRLGQMLSAADFALESGKQRFRLEVGRQATLARVRSGQYMPRDGRVAAMAERASSLNDLSALSPEAAVRVFWLSGKSGAGKSVLLLQLLEHLVSIGRRVLWLGSDAGLVDRTLRDLQNVPAHEAPEFIAIDDLYDRDAREQLELAALAGYIDEQGRRPWPLLITCGPTEFADAFVDASRFRGFEVTTAPVIPLGEVEATDLLRWVEAKRGTLASGEGDAFAQAQHGQGLFVSMASELEFGDLREFAARFCERVSAVSLREPLRPMLALNRLYLRAPYRWLSNSDRERLEVLNRDGDFSLLELSSGSALVRLTHPHLSDAIYRALVNPATPLAFANDLASAFERALDEGDDPLAARLLRTFSASDQSLVADRLLDVNMPALAKRCVAKWRSLPPGGDRRIQSDIAISWACWPAAHASLGSSAERLVQAALDTMALWRDSDPRQSYWPAFWWRLWRVHPHTESLASWAEQRIISDNGLKLPQWSRIWELLADRDPTKVGIALQLADAAVRWLACNHERTDWHFVWKKLSRQGEIAQETSHRLAAAELGLPAAPCWAFVFQDELAHAVDSRNEAQARALVAQGCTWLTGREDRAEWNFVWRALLERTQLLPQDVDERALVAQGCTWLTGREDRAEWNFVWQALLERTQLLPQNLDERALVAQGCTWLTGREDRAEWAFVWRALLERTQLLPQDVDERALVAQGCTWLTGREDRAEWNFVWRALLERTQLLPQDVDERALVAQGCTWLTGREDRAEWSFVWQALLERTQLLPQNLDERALVAQGCAWLIGREDRSDWLPVFKSMLERRTLLPEGDQDNLQAQALGLLVGLKEYSHGEAGHLLESMMDAGIADEAVVRATLDWLHVDWSHPAWPLVAGKCLQRMADGVQSDALATELVEAIQRHPNAGAWHRLQGIFDASSSAEHSDALKRVQEELVQRKSLAAWKTVTHKWQSGEPMKATVTKRRGRAVNVELEGGLFAILRVADGFRHRPGAVLQVLVSQIDTHLDRIVVLPYLKAAADMTVAHLVPGTDYEGVVTGHQPYGVFVKIGGKTGLVHAKHLADVPSFPAHFPKGSAIQVRLVDVGPKGLVLAIPPAP
ncbi:P-loop NTPase [Delftia acidovorans]